MSRLTPSRVPLAVLVLDQKDARREVQAKAELGRGRSFSLQRALLEERAPRNTGAFLAVLGCRVGVDFPSAVTLVSLT